MPRRAGARARPAAASGLWASTASATTWPAGTRACSTERRPASMRVTSRRSWMRRFMRVAARSITSAGSRDRALRRRAAAPQQRRLHEDGAERVAQVVGDDAEHVVARLDGALGGAIEPRVLDRERRAAGELFAQPEIRRAVHPGRSPTTRATITPRSLPCASERHRDDRARSRRREAPGGAPRSGRERREQLRRQAAAGGPAAPGLEDRPQPGAGALRSSGSCASTSQAHAWDGVAAHDLQAPDLARPRPRGPRCTGPRGRAPPAGRRCVSVSS